MDSTTAAKERDSRFTQSVGSVSPAAAQYGHEQATQSLPTKLRRTIVRKATPVITLTTDRSAWKAANNVASQVAAKTFASNPGVPALASVASNASKRRQYIQDLIVRVGPKTLIVCNSPSHASQVRETIVVS